MGWQFVIPGYFALFVGFGLYTFWLLRRARKVSANVPKEKRRFLE